MGISVKTHKLLWGRSGNQCAICKTELIVSSGELSEDPSIVGDEAHIIARSESFTRGDSDALAPEERDSYFNLILLCKTHHKQVDDQPATFSVERLREIKAKHEQEVRSNLTQSKEKKQDDEIIYSGYIDEWQRLADLESWRNLSCQVTSSDVPTLPKSWYEGQRQFGIWILGRIWPKRYPKLEDALLNYKTIAQDFVNVFDLHVESRRSVDSCLYTERFYKIPEWDAKLYNKLLREFNEHVDLLCDLFFELTRAANYVCDHVREYIFSGYRLDEGVLLVERYNVGFEMRTIHTRPEYRGKERTRTPYPGLKRFKKIRYTRDFAIDPNPPEPPWANQEEQR